MERLVELLAFGLSQGGVYVLMAVGFTLIYGILHLINFSHGELYMIGAYTAFFGGQAFGWGYGWSILFAIVACAVVGVSIERVAFKPLRRAPDALMGLISSLGVSIALQNLAVLIWSARPVMFHSPFSQSVVDIGAATVNLQRIVILAVSTLLIVGVYLVLEKTELGFRIRATAQDYEVAQLMGVNTERVIMATFAMGGALAGAAGGLVMPLYVLDPFAGVDALLKAFVVVILGGFGNITGAITAGFLVGILDALISGYLSSAYSEAILFTVVVLILLVRPTGLFAERQGSRV